MNVNSLPPGQYRELMRELDWWDNTVRQLEVSLQKGEITREEFLSQKFQMGDIFRRRLQGYDWYRPREEAGPEPPEQ